MKNINELKGDSRKEFFVSQGLILAALFVIVAACFGIFYKNAKRVQIRDGQNTIESVSKNLESFLIQKRTELEHAANTVSFLKKKGAYGTQISDFLKYVSSSKSTGYYGIIGGKYIDGTGWIPGDDFNPEKQIWYTGAVNANGRSVISSPYYDTLKSRYIVSISKLLDDNKSVVSMDIMITDIQNYAVKLLQNKRDIIFVLDHEGYVIAHTDEEQHGRNLIRTSDSPESRIIKRIFFNPEKELFMETTFNNEAKLLFSRKILQEWYIVVLSDKSALVVRTMKNLAPVTVGLILIVGFMLFLCTLNFTARLKTNKYAQMLSKYKTELEHQVVDQWNQLDKKTHDLVQMQETVIEGMATVIEYRDVNTGMHVKNTKRYVLMIANYLLEHGLHTDEVNSKYISMIGNAAAMHDIGKVAISDRILNKPGKLDDDEFEVMKSHTIIGAGLVRQVFGDTIPEEMLRMCVDVVQYHHEKWNGRGYPIGLEGEDIPLSARIMAIADVFDAIVSKRVYKDAVPVDEVFAIIEKDAGFHFDPELAAIFLTMKDEIKEYLDSKKPANESIPEL